MEFVGGLGGARFGYGGVSRKVSSSRNQPALTDAASDAEDNEEMEMT